MAKSNCWEVTGCGRQPGGPNRPSQRVAQEEGGSLLTARTILSTLEGL